MPKTARRSAARSAARGTFLALVLTIAACVESSPAGPGPSLVPANAFAAILIESPSGLYAAAERLWKAAESRSGGSLAELLGSLLPYAQAAREELDFARPWALAFAPAEPGSNEVRSLLYLPYKTEFDPYLAGIGSSLTVVARASGYMVLSDVDAPVEFPPRDGLDLSRLTRYPAGSVKLWLDPAAAARRAVGGYDPIERSIRTFVTGEEPAAEPLAAATDLMLGLLEQIRAADAALIPSSRGLELRAGASIAEGGELAEAFAAAASAPSALDWADRLEPDRLYSYAWSIDGASSAELSARMAAASLRALGIESAALEGMAAFQERAAALAGPRGAMSIDMDFDPEALTRLEKASPAELSSAIEKAFSLRIDVAQETREETAFAAFVRGLPDDPDLARFLEPYGATFGIAMKLENAERKTGSFSYGELGLRLSVPDPSRFGAAADGSDGASEAIDSAFAAASELLTLRWTSSRGSFFGTTADATALKALAATPAPGTGPLPGYPELAAFAAEIPGKPVMVGSVSAKRLLELAAKFAVLAEPGDSADESDLPDPERFGPWYSYASTIEEPSAPRFEIGLLAPASDVGAIFDAIRSASEDATEPDA